MQGDAWRKQKPFKSRKCVQLRDEKRDMGWSRVQEGKRLGVMPNFFLLPILNYVKEH